MRQLLPTPQIHPMNPLVGYIPRPLDHRWREHLVSCQEDPTTLDGEVRICRARPPIRMPPYLWPAHYPRTPTSLQLRLPQTPHRICRLPRVSHQSLSLNSHRMSDIQDTSRLVVIMALRMSASLRKMIPALTQDTNLLTEATSLLQ